MSERIRKIAQKVVEGLVWSARATAWHEAQPWEPDDRQARAQRGADHQ